MRENADGAKLDQARSTVGTEIAGEDDHRDPLGARIALERVHHLLPGHVGKAQIQDDDVRRMVARQLDAEPSQHRRFDRHLRPAIEHTLDQLDVDQVVLYLEDPNRRRNGVGLDLGLGGPAESNDTT